MSAGPAPYKYEKLNESDIELGFQNLYNQYYLWQHLYIFAVFINEKKTKKN